MEHNPRAPPMEHMEGKEQTHIKKSAILDRKYLEYALWESQRNDDAPIMDGGGLSDSRQ